MFAGITLCNALNVEPKIWKEHTSERETLLRTFFKAGIMKSNMKTTYLLWLQSVIFCKWGKRNLLHICKEFRTIHIVFVFIFGNNNQIEPFFPSITFYGFEKFAVTGMGKILTYKGVSPEQQTCCFFSIHDSNKNCTQHWIYYAEKNLNTFCIIRGKKMKPHNKFKRLPSF